MLTTLQHGLGVIEQLAPGPLTVREIAERTGLPRQSAYRLAATLVDCGWVRLDSATNTYSLTRRAWSTGVMSFEGSDLRDAWAPTVRELARTGETVHLGVYERGEVIYIDKADGSHPVRAYSQLGGRAPAHCVATGKVLLAFADRLEREAVLSRPLARPTDRSISDPSALVTHLATVVERGYATNLGEWSREVGGIAVPIHSAVGTVVAAIGFSAPLGRLVGRREELLESLRAALAQQGG